jgi:Membrane protein involved in colicin uptake
MSYREERRADQAAAAEQAREDKRLMLEAQLKAKEIDAEQRRADAELKADQARKDAEAKRRQEQADKKAGDAQKAARAAAKAAKRAKLRRWLKTNPATLFVAFVMVASIVPAVISQVAALMHGGVFILLAALLASMLEGGAWAITFMGKQAEDAGRPTGKYRIGTWCTATIAAVIQFWHWSEIAPLWVALVFAGSSLFAIYIWDLKTHGSHGTTRAQRREAKARKAHEGARRKHHKKIAEQADRLKSAMPYGVLDDETAFAAAWRIATGAEPAMSAELYAQATNATVALGAAFELGEHARPELLETGLRAAQFNPFKEIGRTPTAQAGIGLYGSETPLEDGSEATPSGRTDEELEALLPDALVAAAELVAEGAQISAAGLAKKLTIRREDAKKLRDLVIAERKLHVA